MRRRSQAVPSPPARGRTKSAPASVKQAPKPRARAVNRTPGSACPRFSSKWRGREAAAAAGGGGAGGVPPIPRPGAPPSASPEAARERSSHPETKERADLMVVTPGADSKARVYGRHDSPVKAAGIPP